MSGQYVIQAQSEDEKVISEISADFSLYNPINLMHENDEIQVME